MDSDHDQIIRNDDGTLTVRAASSAAPRGWRRRRRVGTPTSATLHPGEGGYDEALAQWDLQQNPDRGPAVSTASGRDEAMAVVHEVATDEDHDPTRSSSRRSRGSTTRSQRRGAATRARRWRAVGRGIRGRGRRGRGRRPDPRPTRSPRSSARCSTSSTTDGRRGALTMLAPAVARPGRQPRGSPWIVRSRSVAC